MAKIKFGGNVADARGKLDGVVFSRNQFGAYVRNKVSPVQPQTTRQTLVRDRLTTLSKRWASTLTDSNRAAWTAFAKVQPTVDIFGSKNLLTGLAMFVRINGVRLNLGALVIDTPPADLSVTGLTSASIVAGAGAGTVAITFAATPLGVSEYLYLYATQGLNPGRSFFKPYYRYIGVSAPAEVSPFAAGGLYTAKFGAMVAGQAIGFLVAVAFGSKGAVTPGQFVRVIVGA